MNSNPSIFARVGRFALWLFPRLCFFMVVAIKVTYFKMFMYVIPESSIEGLAILYGLLFVVVMLRVPEEYRQTGLSEFVLWVLAIAFVLGVDWLVIYLTRPDIATVSI